MSFVVGRVRVLAGLIALVVGLSGLVGVGVAHATAGVVYASPAGGGDGSSAASPLDLGSALAAGSPVAGGGTVVMAAGVYSGCFAVNANGTPATPLVVRPAAGARAVIDSAACVGGTSLTINGNDVWVWGIEVTNSDPDRTSAESGSDPSDFRRGNGVNIYGARDKLINAWVHDARNGVGMWDQATDTELYGTIITNSGWVGPDRGHGHGVYVQNEIGGGKQINDTIVLNSYGMGVHGYGTAGHVIGVHVDGTVIANSGGPSAIDANDPTRNANVLIGTEQNPADDVTITNSVLYQPAGTVGGSLRAGYGVTAGSVAITGNYLAGGAQALEVKNWQRVQVTGNTFYATRSANPNASAELAFVQGVSSAALTWNNNAYYDTTGTEPFAYNGTVAPNGSQLLTWPDWLPNTGFDTQSTYAQTTPPNSTIIRPNRYETGRANITVLNWSGQPTTSVDLASTGLQPGQTYELWDANNPSTPVGSGTYTGGPNTIATPSQLTTLVLTPGAAAPAATAPPAETPIAGSTKPSTKQSPKASKPNNGKGGSVPTSVISATAVGDDGVAAGAAAAGVTDAQASSEGPMLAATLAGAILVLNAWIVFAFRRRGSRARQPAIVTITRRPNR
jgi:hypothetical protein